jgi:hypothetical protein
MLQLVLGLAALIATLTAIRTVWLRRAETLRLRRLAREHRLNFSRVDLIGLHDRYHNLSLIRQGHSRRVWNVLYGAHAAGLLAVFRYRYDLGFAANRQTRHLWIAVIETEGDNGRWWAIPRHSVSGQHVSDKSKTSGHCLKSRLLILTGPVATFTPTSGNRPESFSLFVPEAISPIAPEFHPIFPAAEKSAMSLHLEACGPLLAVAVETSASPALPTELLSIAADLSQGTEPD